MLKYPSKENKLFAGMLKSMPLRKGLIKKYLKNLQQTSWYYQRFDGCPQFLGLGAFPHFFQEVRKPEGMEFTDLLVVYTEGTADWHINLKDIQRIAKIFIERSKKESRIGKKLIKQWRLDEKRFYQKCQAVDKIKLKELSNADLAKLYNDFVDTYWKWFSMTSIIDGFALGTDEFINKNVDEFLKQKGIARGRGKIFADLTAPIEISFTTEAEISLLRVAIKMNGYPVLKRAFLTENPENILKKIEHYPLALVVLKKHQQNYFWLKNNYINQSVLTLEDFIIEIKKFYQAKINLNSRLKDALTHPRLNQKKKQSLIKNLNLSKVIKNLLEISEDFTIWQDERKKSTLFTTHFVSLMLREIAKRGKHSFDELRFFAPQEIASLLLKDGFCPSRKEIENRLDFTLFYYRGEGYDFYSGTAGKSLTQKILKGRGVDKVNDFRGMTACPGIAKGKVRVVKSVQEIDKVQPGEILVAVMTRPDYVVGIKRAAAVVTDEGGVTCHAAIVSRELGIPCVIGTKIATKVLSDGDLVEVNANHAVVTILKKANSNN